MLMLHVSIPARSSTNVKVIGLILLSTNVAKSVGDVIEMTGAKGELNVAVKLPVCIFPSSFGLSDHIMVMVTCFSTSYPNGAGEAKYTAYHVFSLSRVYLFIELFPVR